MVTATLTAAAVKSQIACQQQRVQALQATLSTMESGMDKHMLQVQVNYAQGYLESLREQLAVLQGHRLPTDAHPDASDTAPDAADADNPAAVASAPRAEPCVQQHQKQQQLQLPTEQYGCCLAGAASQQQQRLGAECQGNTSSHAAGEAATPVTAEPDYEELTVTGADSSLVDEDDWVCLQDTDTHTSSGDRSGWAGLWSWRKAGAEGSS